MTLKTEIEIELNESIAYSRSDERLGTFCPGCQTIVEMVVPHVASVIAEISEREIYRLVLANDVHFVEAGRLLVCVRSLVDSTAADKGGTRRFDLGTQQL